MIKSTAKKAIRYFSQIIHSLGSDSRFIGPPQGVQTAQELVLRASSFTTIHPIREESTICRKLPNTVESTIHPNFYRDLKREAPPCYVVQLKNGRAVGAQGVAISTDDYIVGDVSRVMGNNPYEFRELYRTRLPKVTHITGHVGLVAGNGGHGFFHWLYDVFPKLSLLGSNATPLDYFIVGYWEKSFVQESLNFYGINERKIIPASEHTHYQATDLFISSLPSNRGNPPVWIIDFLRDVMLNRSRKRRSVTITPRIYITRRDATYRHIQNEAELERYLHGKGFKTIVLSELSLQQQVEVFSSANVIVAPHGAGLSNIAFCQKGVSLIELFSPSYVNVCYWSISNIRDMQYWYTLGNVTDEVSQEQTFRSGILVDLDKLDATLGRALT